MIVFENGDYFRVGSTLSPEPPARCNFQFSDCLCKKGTWRVSPQPHVPRSPSKEPPTQALPSVSAKATDLAQG